MPAKLPEFVPVCVAVVGKGNTSSTDVGVAAANVVAPPPKLDTALGLNEPLPPNLGIKPLISDGVVILPALSASQPISALLLLASVSGF